MIMMCPCIFLTGWVVIWGDLRKKENIRKYTQVGLGCKNKKSRKIKRNLNVEKTEANLFQRSHVTGGCLGAKIMRISKRIASRMIKRKCVSWNYLKKIEHLKKMYHKNIGAVEAHEQKEMCAGKKVFLPG